MAADPVVAPISDAAVKAVPAGVAGQALPEPYVPGSGDRLPAVLRLVLAGHVGLAAVVFAGGLAGAAAAVLALIVVSDLDELAFWLVLVAVSSLLGGLHWAYELLRARSQYLALLRRPSDPYTATVMDSKDGGRTLILEVPWDGTGRGYQPLSEVRLALWMNAGMLAPGERVTVFGKPGRGNPLLISSAHWGRAFLGTITARSTVQPGPIAPLDEKVSGITLVDWAAWAAATTFEYSGLGHGYDTREVDAIRSTVRDTFLGVSDPPVRSDDVRGKQFSTHRLREGYDKTQVDAFLQAAAIRLAAMESTDRPAGPLMVSGATLVAWAEWADSTTFAGGDRTEEEVDAFREEIRDTFLGATRSPVKSDDVRGRKFSSTDEDGYNETQVDAFLDAAGIRLAAMESTDRPDGPLVSGAILAAWAEWADSTEFSTSRRRDEGYDRADVDAFLDAIRDTFHEVQPPHLTWPAAHGKQFTTTRPGYDVEEVDAFLDKAEPKLAAIRRNDPASGTSLTDEPSGPTQRDFRPPPWAERAEWAEWADSTRFSTRRRGGGYTTAEVDAFRQEIRDTFLGVSQPLLTPHEARDKRFTMTRQGYEVQQVDAFCDEAEQRLAAMQAEQWRSAMRPTDTGGRD